MSDANGTWHQVAQGEWLNAIARQYGVGDPDRIWNHSQNAELSQRRSREILYPGDPLFIPAPETKQEDCATEQRHKFVIQTVYDRFEVTLHDPNGKPYKQAKYRLTLDGREFTGQTDGQGTIKLEKLVLSDGASASLELPDLFLRYTIRLGFLNPMKKTGNDDHAGYDDGLSGALMRLRNLGYYNGPIPDGSGEVIDLAQYGDPITRFQTHEMGRDADDADGKLDDKTRDAIESKFLA